MKEETPEERLAKVIFAHPATNGAAPTAPEIAALCEDLAAVVLAHLTAEGWAQGREEWGVEFTAAGRWVEPYPNRTVAEREVEAGPNCRLMHRFKGGVTDWEPVDG